MANVNTGRVSPATRAKLFDQFRQFDKDRNGFISPKEAEEVLLKRCGFPPEKTRRLLQMCDRNHDGQLSYDEFIAFYFKVQEAIEDLSGLFTRADTSGDGEVSRQEAEQILKEKAFSKQQMDAMLDVHDANRDGVLHYHEMVHFWN